MEKPTIVFAGTPEFARVSLAALVEAGFLPRVVLTQPDRPAGRGKKLTASAVKTYALAQDIDVWQPHSLKGDPIVADLRALEPDLMVVAAYGLILPQRVLDIPKYGCVNVHASLLPRWRGAAPIQHAILSGDRESGITLMEMAAGLDTGPMLRRAALSIGITETAGELHDRLATLGGQMLAENMWDLAHGRIAAETQDDSLATYAAKITSRDALIDWSRTATEIDRQVRAFNPVPGARFALRDEIIKCWQVEVLPQASGSPGAVIGTGKQGIEVACGDGGVRLLQVQRPGRRRIRAAELAAQSDLSGALLA